MKNKSLIAVAVGMALLVASHAYAAGKDDNAGAGSQPNQQQTETANQGENDQIETQNNEQAQSGDTAGINAEKPAQQQTQQQLQDGSEAGEQVKNQNQTQAEQSEEEDIPGSALAQERRSQVANAVQELLQVAERNGGIGEQVRVIAQEQNQNQEKLEASLEKVQSRSGLAKFFIGPNYGEINNAQKLLEQNRERIQQLNQLEDQLANQGDQQLLAQQIQILEQAGSAVENSLGAAKKGFSLLGWAFRLFIR
ncbi:MAG: hypothetical protein WC668_00430 [Patescibacteria group bacterium]